MVNFLSIGIPVWNEAESLPISVEYILRSSAWVNAPIGKKELIICVNGVTKQNDPTLQVAYEIAS